MKPKTKLKLEKKWLSLPIHFIDTSVVYGAFLEGEEFKIECNNYLNKIGYKYRGHLSISVIGEIFMILQDKVVSESDKEFFIRFFYRLIIKRAIALIGTSFEAYKKALELRNFSYQLDPTDTLHLAVAITSGTRKFVTLDQKLIENLEIQTKFDIDILHPKDL